MNGTIDGRPAGAAFSRFRLLVWTSFVLGILGMLASPEAALVRGMGSTITGIVVAGLALMYGTSAWVNVQLIRGRNWARIAYTAGVVFWVLMQAERSDAGTLEMLLMAVELVVDVYLVYLMFTDPVRTLFSKAPRQAQPAGG